MTLVLMLLIMLPILLDAADGDHGGEEDGWVVGLQFVPVPPNNLQRRLAALSWLANLSHLSNLSNPSHFSHRFNLFHLPPSRPAQVRM